MRKISEISFESVKKINELIDELSYYKKVQEFKMDALEASITNPYRSSRNVFFAMYNRSAI